MTNMQPSKLPTRLQREYRTVEVMISIFCNKHHRLQFVCNDCKELRDYALERLEICPFRKEKPTCAKCPVHCYKPVMREKIREVMRYAGPRMIFRHPVMAIRHILDSRREDKRLQIR
ncbi:MAG: nitrous oxide-stimulated promoter family protein [Dehalococcoidales bacterium]|nr:MAG: nitrous oxide-stimulated promoter family protein [Dehalococcoidales bacterium]